VSVTLGKCSSVLVVGSIEAVVTWSFSNFTGADGVLIVRLSQTSVIISLSVVVWVRRTLSKNFGS
jgi:hypothetical protein